MKLFSFLDPLLKAGFCASFIPRIESVKGSYNKEEALQELEPHHREAVENLGYGWESLWRAEQVHGVEIARVPLRAPSFAESSSGQVIKGVDGLLTDEDDTLLGIYVADCGLIWLADRQTGAVGLLHSGRKGDFDASSSSNGGGVRHPTRGSYRRPRALYPASSL